RVMGGGQATKYPTRREGPKASASPGAIPGHAASPSAADLCHQYFQILFQPSPGDSAKEKELYGELRRLADSRHVIGYCMQQLSPYQKPSPWPAPPGDTGH